MLKLFKYFFIMLLPMFMHGQIDSTWNLKKNKIIIPFELANNLIVIDANLNGSNLKMILDTGTELNILFGVGNNDSISINYTRKTKITGLGLEEPLNAIISDGNTLKIENYIDNDFSIVTINESNINIINKFGHEINGVIGYSFLKNRLIKIDFQRKRIIIFKSKKELLKKKYKKFSIKKISFFKKKPYVNLNVNIENKNHNLKLLLDTGLSDGLWLFNTDMYINKKQIIINDYLGYGLSGEILGMRSRLEKISFSDFIFEDLIVSFPDKHLFNNVELLNKRDGLLGGEIIKRFHILLDYSNKKIYLKKNNLFDDPFNYNMSGIEIQHVGLETVMEEVRLNLRATEITISDYYKDNSQFRYNYKFSLKPIYIISNVRENSPAFIAGIVKGDKVIKINNKRANDFTMQKITDLFQSEDGKKIKMEVEREGKIIEVIFYLKKII